MAPANVAIALEEVTGHLPSGGERRIGQAEMADAVAHAIAAERHLVVQAGTGTGKSLAYLVPVLLSGRRAIVATATKALQDQLASKDLPFLEEHLGRPFRFAVLKGRSNYVCRQRVAELDKADQLDLDVDAEIDRLVSWAAQTESGDRAELAFEPSARAWDAVSVGPRECPGRHRCPHGDTCFTEQARDAAAAADVIVVNTHLLGLHLASGGAILPDSDVVVVDEAHQLEDIVSATAGFTISGGRFAALARAVRSILVDESTIEGIESAGARVTAALADHVGRRLAMPLDAELGGALDSARNRVERALSALRRMPDHDDRDVEARKQRAVQAATALISDIDASRLVPDGDVAWVDGPPHSPALHVAPIDVGDVLRPTLWSEYTAVLTSATVPLRLPEVLGMEDDSFDAIDVGSPFDFESNALLYCAAHLPDPRSGGFDEAMLAELEALIHAAGGRTLALFTSWRALDAAAEHLEGSGDWPLLVQGQLPKTKLLDAFTETPESVLFATLSFWQGVDVPGPSLSLVTIDRLPFPRPDDPLLDARRERAGPAAFRMVDLPRAATMLAQGAGRLIRTTTDRGVVAVFDPRLATKKSYRWDMIRGLPPFRRTSDRAEVESFLRALRDD